MAELNTLENQDTDQAGNGAEWHQGGLKPS